MTREARIKEIENDMFYLEMKDFWTNEDFEYNRKLAKELRELKGIKEVKREEQKQEMSEADKEWYRALALLESGVTITWD